MDFLEVLATFVQHRFAQANGGSTNTTKAYAFHALLLPSKYYYYYPLNITDVMIEHRDIHDF